MSRLHIIDSYTENRKNAGGRYEMKSNKLVIMVISRNGTGKIRSFRISPCLLRLFAFLILLCVVSVPVLERGLFTLSNEVYDLYEKEKTLYQEIASLQYLRNNLALIARKDTELRSYFGLEKYNALEPIIVGGGELNFKEVMDVSHRSGAEPALWKPVTTKTTVLPTQLKKLCKNHAILNQLIIKQEEARKYTPSIVPTDSGNPRFTSGFGWRKNPFTDRREFHSGLDIIGPKGTKIVSPADGVVITRGCDRWLGNYVVVQHTQKLKTIYGHLEKVTVKEGLKVKRGHVLGLMGNSGMSTSHHLHYMVVLNGRVIDPGQYILNMRG
jgi:murein DD-endopeptidase MepM/ murein hydrolase activator NlpD